MWRLWNKLFGWHYVKVYCGGEVRILRLEKTEYQQDIKYCFFVFGKEIIIVSHYTGISRDANHFYTIIPLTFKTEELIK